jgi:hypothetical protein
MSERITLPSGNWIQLRDYRELRRGDKKRALKAVEDPESLLGSSYDVVDGLLAVLVESWSYPLPLPSVDPSVVEQLPYEDDNDIVEAVGPAARALFSKKPAPTEEQVADAASPTEPSDG